MRKLTVALWILLAGAVSPAAGQEGECGEWRMSHVDPHTMHWAQSPMGPSVSLGRLALADDFLCTQAGPVGHIHLWGFFLNDDVPKGGTGNLRFELAICSDVETKGRGNLPGSRRPGSVLWTRVFEPGEYLTTAGPGGALYDPETGDLSLAQLDHLGVQYTFCIEEEPFLQEEGTVYWLVVRELSGNADEYGFGWQGTDPALHWNTPALYRVNNNARADWREMSYPEGRQAGEPLDLAFVISNSEASATRDLGSAPDSTNSFPGVAMTAYEGVPANFPTVYRAGSPPHGPLHLHPRDRFFLGRHVTLENEADVGLDEDWGDRPLLPHNNLLPLSDWADAETNHQSRPGVPWGLSDDGLAIDSVSFPVSLPTCERTRLDYRVTVTDPNAALAYVNVWCDWNRDGDWNDTLMCGRVPVPEWAVQNDTPAFTGAGEYVFTSQSFRCWHPEGRELDRIWVRITLAEQEWTPQAEGGAGPEGGYQYGETEDYLFPPVARSPQFDWGDAPDSLAVPGYPVLATHNGARHAIGGPWLGGSDDRASSGDRIDTWQRTADSSGSWSLGDSPDAEGDGQPEANARGDDKDGWDDEEGVVIPPLTAGLSAGVTFQVRGGGGVVQLWIDYDSDKTWETSEKVFEGVRADGVHMISFGVPPTAVAGKTFARVRLSTAGGLAADGPAEDGEVEDHEVVIVTPPATILPGAVTQCPSVVTQCPTILTQCPPVETRCPVEETKCPVSETRCPPTETACPMQQTACPTINTKCPPLATQCPVVETECPATPTECAIVYTQCPALQTRCPPVETKCPVTSTRCPPVSTSCPAVLTQCPTSSTHCPMTLTRCPSCGLKGLGSEELPEILGDLLRMPCPVVETNCPRLTGAVATVTAGQNNPQAAGL